MICNIFDRNLKYVKQFEQNQAMFLAFINILNY